MFIGEYRHNTDNKGRIIIPARFRDDLGERVVLTRGLDGCITVYTLAQWNKVLEGLRVLPTTKKESRMYIHMLTAKAAECEFDAQGRVLLPQSLIQEAAIEKECVVIGVVDHVEIWSSHRWDTYYADASASFETIAEQLTEYVK
ncbi:MAG TPA: cell division/cell wall cluster transcriptional repressor MraZ [Erysipelotrichaceae bacterium]|nr:cell division/cell wall cluster transcriptional repressor MraZ [Erysipelotrichaceae bacterium]